MTKKTNSSEHFADRGHLFAPVKRIVVKVGTRVIMADNRTASVASITKLTKEIVQIRKKGIEVVIVSSGAVGIGMSILGLQKRPQQIPQLQAVAAVGQNKLVHLYQHTFSKFKQNIGQVLLTATDLKLRANCVNIKNTISSLLYYNVIPIINENDSVGTDELKPNNSAVSKIIQAGVKFGDNDILAAHITNIVGADLMIILTDIDGLYSGDPKKKKSAQRLDLVKKITPQLERLAGREGSFVSVGGMKTKLKAAKIVTQSGDMVIIAHGLKDSLTDIVDGKKVGTLFLPNRPRKLSSLKRWIAFTSETQGKLVVDTGAQRALVTDRKSLLPSGIVNTKGTFKVGEFVALENTKGDLFAKGKTLYSSRDVKKIIGKNSSEIAKILGRKKTDEVIHRDHLVVIA